MADAYGTVTFSKSNDCVVDLEGLQKLLNQYEWDNSGAKWDCIESGLLYLGNYAFHLPQYPTAIPKEVQAYELFNGEYEGNNRFIQKPIEQMTEEDWDLVAGSIEVPIPLGKLSDLISPLMKSGWIEIACVANEKSRYVYFESLKIFFDGRASRKSVKSGPYVGSEEEFFEYAPEKIAA